MKYILHLLFKLLGYDSLTYFLTRFANLPKSLLIRPHSAPPLKVTGEMWRYQKPGFQALLLAELQRQQQGRQFCDTLLKTEGVNTRRRLAPPLGRPRLGDIISLLLSSLLTSLLSFQAYRCRRTVAFSQPSALTSPPLCPRRRRSSRARAASWSSGLSEPARCSTWSDWCTLERWQGRVGRRRSNRRFRPPPSWASTGWWRSQKKETGRADARRAGAQG